MNTKKEDKSSFKKVIYSETFRRIFIILCTQLAILTLMRSSGRNIIHNMTLDMPAPYTVVSDRDFLLEDEEATRKKIEEEAEKVPFVYDYSPFGIFTTLKRLEEIFKNITAQNKKMLNPQDIRSFLKTSAGIDLSVDEVSYLLSRNFSPSLLKEIEALLSFTRESYILPDKEPFEKHFEKGVVVRILREDGKIYGEMKLEKPSNLLLISDAKNILGKKGGKREIISIAEKIIAPNLFFNESETLKRRYEAGRRVTPVFHSVKKGEVIIRAGDRVTEDAWKKLKTLEELRGASSNWKVYAGASLLNLFVFFAAFYYLPGRIKGLKISVRDVSFISILLIFSLSIIKLFIYIGDALTLKVGREMGTAFFFTIPIPMVPMVIFTTLGFSPALLTLLIMIGLSFTIFSIHPYAILFHLLSGLTVLYFLTSRRMRIAIVKVGFRSTLWNILFATGIGLITWTEGAGSFLKSNLAGALCGILSGVLSAGILPLAESVFGYTSELKLLELSYREHPLLKRLAVEAPGSFQHSLMVSDLAEEAAEAIGANSTIAKIGALYHDIGKLKNPGYFIENQAPTYNPHDHLSPKISALIVISHVKEGKEMALKYKLPPEIVDIIEQHHGTSVVQYFYDKAKRTWSPDKAEVNADDFRYPGPKPKTKEAGIVMMADRAEAAVRVLDSFTPHKIESVLKEIFMKLLEDGQLDECDLATNEISLIKEIFLKKLLATYHKRIDYPSTLKGVVKKAKIIPVRENDKNLNSR